MTTSLDVGVEGQATYGMANLRPERTGLPFIVFISQRDDARHDARHAARVKVSTAPKVRSDRMGSYGGSPFEHKAGVALSGPEERQLEAWIALNRDVIEDYWDGNIEYTEDAIERLRRV